jgi:hypothetical protein
MVTEYHKRGRWERRVARNLLERFVNLHVALEDIGQEFGKAKPFALCLFRVVFPDASLDVSGEIGEALVRDVMETALGGSEIDFLGQVLFVWVGHSPSK